MQHESARSAVASSLRCRAAASFASRHIDDLAQRHDVLVRRARPHAPRPISRLASLPNRGRRVALWAPAVILLSACSLFAERADEKQEVTSKSSAAERSTETSPSRDRIVLANGNKNWIDIDGMARSGDRLRFAEVQIDGNGWLVLHPFKGGAPNGKVYVGATYLNDGNNRNVTVTVTPPPTAGEKFIVMLHRDVNENKQFDFVFVDERNVLDRAVFEGNTMIAHAIKAP